jgi:acyl carrier protein
MNIEDSVQQIFRDVFDNEALSIGRDTSSKDIEDWDSLAQINLIVAMEKEFNVKFTIAEIEPLRDVGGMIDLIYQKAGK